MIFTGTSVAGFNTARAEPVFGVATGYSMGSLKRKITESFTTLGFIGYAGYNLGGFNIHGFFHHMDLSYNVSGATYSGLYALSGIGAGYQFSPSRKGHFSLTAQYPMSTNYSVLSESSSTVNGQTYRYSELTTLTGGTAYQILAGYNYLIEGIGGHKRGENLHAGVQLGYLHQQFATQATRIKTNNSLLAPPSTGNQPVSHSATVLSLFLFISYDI